MFMDISIQDSPVPSNEHTATLDSITINVPTFEELHTEYHQYVRRRVCTLLRYRPALIDDAIQETWIKVWKYLPRITSTDNLKAWLWHVATNTVRDAMRRERSRDLHQHSLEAKLEYFDIAPENFAAAIVPDPHDYLPERLERQARRQRIWPRLSTKDRQTFLAVVQEQPFELQDLYAARRRYKRASKREQEEMAS
jgi:RNA polymerase sigma factor (sigma-70 family)